MHSHITHTYHPPESENVTHTYHLSEPETFAAPPPQQAHQRIIMQADRDQRPLYTQPWPHAQQQRQTTPPVNYIQV
jgi:hypothetical protein